MNCVEFISTTILPCTSLRFARSARPCVLANTHPPTSSSRDEGLLIDQVRLRQLSNPLGRIRRNHHEYVQVRRFSREPAVLADNEAANAVAVQVG